MFSIVTTLLMANCGNRTVVRNRPSSLPTEALWSDGSDGGAWIDCRFTTKEPYVGYDCAVFHDDGKPWADGPFALAEIGRDQKINHHLPVFAGGVLSSFNFYDGERIYLSGERVLVPHGEVTYSTGKSHGVRIQYEFGQRTLEATF